MVHLAVVGPHFEEHVDIPAEIMDEIMRRVSDRCSNFDASTLHHLLVAMRATTTRIDLPLNS
jgi:hypothetical protein